MPSSTNFEESEVNEDTTNEYNQQLEDNDPEDEGNEVPEEDKENRDNYLRRGRGRPKLLRTGQRGRPKKFISNVSTQIMILLM